jgi:hypothetical protein
MTEGRGHLENMGKDNETEKPARGVERKGEQWGGGGAMSLAAYISHFIILLVVWTKRAI